jgi:hypothetical protein
MIQYGGRYGRIAVIDVPQPRRSRSCAEFERALDHTPQTLLVLELDDCEPFLFGGKIQAVEFGELLLGDTHLDERALGLTDHLVYRRVDGERDGLVHGVGKRMEDERHGHQHNKREPEEDQVAQVCRKLLLQKRAHDRGARDGAAHPSSPYP